MVHLAPLWQPMQLPWPWPVKSAAPAVTSAVTRLVGARGERMVWIQLVMSAQLVAAPAAPPAAVVALEPWRPCCCGVELSVLMRSAFTGGELTAETMAPTP